MSINRRSFLSYCTAGITGLAAIVSNLHNSSATLSNRKFVSDRQFKKEYEQAKERLNQERKKRDFIFEYEEWKKTIENPDSESSCSLKRKAKLMSEFPEFTKSLLNEREIKEYEQFWKNFHLDISKFPFEKDNEELNDFIMNTALPVIIEMQVEIDRTYGTFFNYQRLNEGQKVIIYLHFKHRGKYYSEGNKMPEIFK